MKKLSVIIPVYNEKNTFLELLRRIEAVNLPLEKEIIIVDDYSSDGTGDILKRLNAAEYKIILKEKNEGKGSALKRGFLEATGDIVIIQDADLEYDPEDYKKVLQPILDGEADVVYGSRFSGSYKPPKGLRLSYFANRFLTSVSNIFTSLKLTDMETCYKAFRKEVVDGFKDKILSKRFGIEPELTARIARKGWRVKETQISYKGRVSEEGKKINWKDGLAAVWHIAKFNFFNPRVLSFFGLILVLVFVSLYSLSNLTTKPALWFDEGLTIEIAHNFLLFQKLDITTAPGVFSGFPFAMGTNGYPLTIPLAGFFEIFGFGLAQGRIFMLLWMLLVLSSVYYVVRGIFGVASAVAAVFLLSTFASFYGNGLTVVGEMPGFFFLIWGMFFLFKKQSYGWAGFFFGLAAVAKPSIHLLLFPAFLLFLIFFDRRRFLKKLFRFGIGALPSILFWIYLVFPNPFLVSSWRTLFSYYTDPYGLSISASVSKNLLLVFSHSTLVYFFLLTIIILGALFLKNIVENDKKKVFKFILIYIFFAFVYFLKSLGWIRYISSAEFLILIFIFPAISAIFGKARSNFFPALFRPKLKSIFPCAILAALVLIQFFHLFFYADISRSSVFNEICSFIKNEKPNATVGLIDLPQVAAFVPNEKKYHVTKTMFVPQVGENPLSFPAGLLPDIIVFQKGGRGEKEFIASREDVLSANYRLVKEFGGYLVFERP